jgi:hypothetical protein
MYTDESRDLDTPLRIRLFYNWTAIRDSSEYGVDAHFGNMLSLSDEIIDKQGLILFDYKEIFSFNIEFAIIEIDAPPKFEFIRVDMQKEVERRGTKW